MQRATGRHLGWFGMVRLGLVQMALGSIVVLTTSTLNRVMVVELALPAMLPGALVGLHYGVQMMRPRWGHGADQGGRRTPWILWGMALLALGGVAAAWATVLMASAPGLGLMAAVVAFVVIGIGVGAAGTNLLALMAVRVAPARRAAAATIAWLMMIGGIAVTAGVAGGLLDPFSHQRLIAVACGVAALAFTLAVLGVAGVERGALPGSDNSPRRTRVRFRAALSEVWAEPQARVFTLFVFASMLAYSAQDLILEPFAGHVFGMTPGQSTQLAGVQHGGVFLGMAVVGVLGTAWGRGRPAVLRGWTIWGCIGSALALIALAWGGQMGPGWPLGLNVFVLGAFNGAFAVAAIGSMMGLASDGAGGREGTRVGLWGAAQAVAFGLGGFLGTVAVDAARALMADPAAAYSIVFAGEGVLFLVSAILAARVGRDLRDAPLHGAAAGIAGE